MRVTLYKRLSPGEQVSDEGHWIRAKVASVDHDRVTFQQDDDGAFVEMKLTSENSRGEFMVGARFAIVLSGEREAVA